MGTVGGGDSWGGRWGGGGVGEDAAARQQRGVRIQKGGGTPELCLAEDFDHGGGRGEVGRFRCLMGNPVPGIPGQETGCRLPRGALCGSAPGPTRMRKHV